MQIKINFFSYFKDLTGQAEVEEEVLPGTSLQELLQRLRQRFPKLEPMRNSTLVAVGVEYQTGDYKLQPGDEISLFPPVQGG